MYVPPESVFTSIGVEPTLLMSSRRIAHVSRCSVRRPQALSGAPMAVLAACAK